MLEDDKPALGAAEPQAEVPAAVAVKESAAASTAEPTAAPPSADAPRAVATNPPEPTEETSSSEAASIESVASAPLAPPAPVNKLHEWAAAVLIMGILSLILVAFLLFLREASL